MNNFLVSYIETALWSSNDEHGEPLDSAKYADVELHPDTLKRFETDCEQFETAYLNLIAGLDDSVLRSIPDHIAHDFWLTRNRHGAGFWDGDYPEPLATQLTDLSHTFGECDLYIGDDGLLYV